MSGPHAQPCFNCRGVRYYVSGVRQEDDPVDSCTCDEGTSPFNLPSDDEILTDAAALQAFEDGEFLAADAEPAINRAMVRSPRYTFDRYQAFTRTTAIYPGHGEGTPEAIVYCSLKLAGEAGEAAEKIGKLIRGGGFQALASIDAETKTALARELGDVLWYVAGLADELGLKLSEVAGLNVSKLSSRKVRGVIHGSGDDR